MGIGSVPDAMGWGAVSLTTAGYGDIYSVTVPRKFIGAFIAVLGIGLFTLPAGIIRKYAPMRKSYECNNGRG